MAIVQNKTMAWSEFTSIESHFPFGKYKGGTLGDVIDRDPDYLTWCMMHIDGILLHDSAIEEIRLAFPEFPISPEFENRRQQNWESYQDDFDECSVPEDFVECYDPIDCDDNFSFNDEPTYERYHGYYAQDEAGYSDDEIDIIFDGEPDAYWNID